jgi:hypothetical protein
MTTFEVVSIDAWRSSEGGWFWNASYRCGSIEIDPKDLSKPRKLLFALRKVGILTSNSAGRVRVDYSGSDPETIEIQDKNTYEPLVAITVDWSEVETEG